MKGNEPPKDGFRTNPNYRRKKTYKGPKYRWVATPHGLFCKILAQIICEAWEGEVGSVKRKMTPKQYLDAQMKFFVPWIYEIYEKARGKPLTPEVLYHRNHKGDYDYKAEDPLYRARRSTEHYTINKDMKPHIHKVEALYRRGKPISFDEAVAACSQDGPFNFK